MINDYSFLNLPLLGIATVNLESATGSNDRRNQDPELGVRELMETITLSCRRCLIIHTICGVLEVIVVDKHGAAACKTTFPRLSPADLSL